MLCFHAKNQFWQKWAGRGSADLKSWWPPLQNSIFAKTSDGCTATLFYVHSLISYSHTHQSLPLAPISPGGWEGLSQEAGCQKASPSHGQKSSNNIRLQQLWIVYPYIMICQTSKAIHISKNYKKYRTTYFQVLRRINFLTSVWSHAVTVLSAVIYKKTLLKFSRSKSETMGDASRLRWERILYSDHRRQVQRSHNNARNWGQKVVYKCPEFTPSPQKIFIPYHSTDDHESADSS